MFPLLPFPSKKKTKPTQFLSVFAGGCPVEDRRYSYTPSFPLASLTGEDGMVSAMDLGPASANFSCQKGGVMRSGGTWLGIFGGIIMVVLTAKKVNGAVMAGILFVTFVSWIQVCSLLQKTEPVESLAMIRLLKMRRALCWRVSWVA